MGLRFRLDELMEERNISQARLARDTAIAINTLRAYRHNWIKRPDLDIIEKLCQYFGVSVAELIVRDDASPRLEL
ncbi:MAG: helix-turn-helix transcriptional regulator [Anaerolineae bacterium]|nr:helix-turn-helix transcriptional regulator [Anaerolineae bacterium]